MKTFHDTIISSFFPWHKLKSYPLLTSLQAMSKIIIYHFILRLVYIILMRIVYNCESDNKSRCCPVSYEILFNLSWLWDWSFNEINFENCRGVSVQIFWWHLFLKMTSCGFVRRKMRNDKIVFKKIFYFNQNIIQSCSQCLTQSQLEWFGSYTLWRLVTSVMGQFGQQTDFLWKLTQSDVNIRSSTKSPKNSYQI